MSVTEDIWTELQADFKDKRKIYEEGFDGLKRGKLRGIMSYN